MVRKKIEPDAVADKLRAEIETNRAALKQLREERCLDAIQRAIMDHQRLVEAILKAHQCHLVPRGDGMTEVKLDDNVDLVTGKATVDGVA